MSVAVFLLFHRLVEPALREVSLTVFFLELRVPSQRVHIYYHRLMGLKYTPHDKPVGLQCLVCIMKLAEESTA